MTRHIREVAVLGAGTMGAQIAAHFANAGVPALLLDVTPDAARQGLDRAKALKPDPFFTPDTLALVRTGGFDEDLAAIARCDWIIEAIVERLDVKQSLFARVESHRRADAVVSSNTSGIPIAALSAGRSESFRRHFLGTHFFNPPRYLRLLEVIPTADTDPAIVQFLTAYADRRLGKGVVVCEGHAKLHREPSRPVRLDADLPRAGRRDTRSRKSTRSRGPPSGVRKAHLPHDGHRGHRRARARFTKPGRAPRVARDRAVFEVPALVAAMVERGWIGQRRARGFYKKAPDGQILTLDPASMEYRPKQAVKLSSLDAARSIDDVGERIRTLLKGEDKVGRFLRATLIPTLEYTERVAPQIAHDRADIDHAMRWGFGWELGPFETMRYTGREAGAASVGRARTIVKRNAGASLVDLGDGVLSVEFHSKMNAIGGDTIQMLQAGVKEASANFSALVVGNDAVNFSAGANLMLLLLEAQEGNWDDVDMMIRGFQGATMALKYADVPVVVAPAGLALGGGCEVVLHADRVRAAAETYMGLVEVGVGLIPAGGGTKEMLARAMDGAAPGADPLPLVQRVFETIGFAKVSTSGPDARRPVSGGTVDSVSMNRDLLRRMQSRGPGNAWPDYVRPQPRAAIRRGGGGLLATLKLGIHLALRPADHRSRCAIGRKLPGSRRSASLPHATTSPNSSCWTSSAKRS